MGPNPSTPTWGRVCYPTPTPTSSQCFQFLHRMRQTGSNGSFYVRKSALKRLEGVEAFMPMKKCDCIGVMCVPRLLGEEYVPAVAWPKIWGSGAYMPRPTTASSDGVASGRLKGWQKFIPRVIVWDEVCTVHAPTGNFPHRLKGRGVQVICCSDQGQPPTIAVEMPNDWLCAVAQQPANYYEEGKENPPAAW